ncbi:MULTISPECIES: ABC transporter substrate-binding protein [unclassified Aureimonas]|uniref:ABC transporter substrate-binding protein n=1 Tax=unclassified Aureimonas TaxID=2615206 RepID=UPI0006FD556C|nr:MULTISPECIES: ABC transporter substrate-binding protein [unclassified Aureimonas]KQT68948.1 Tat pathway signal protein [Aureimonas sp. Leaf460]KQT69176.1 Tat pathway signal protein [Aureimonas sp. Leaf427]
MTRRPPHPFEGLLSLLSSQPPHVADLTRRRFIAAAGKFGLTALAATQMTSLFAFPALAADAELPEITAVPDALKGSGSVRFCGYGGTFQEAQRKAYLEPFTRLTGIEVIESEGPDTTKIKAMVDTGNYEYDMCENEPGSVLSLQSKGDYFEAMDYSQFDRENIDAGDLTEHYYRMLPYAQIYAYRKDAFDTAPKDNADLWNREAFPGPRAMQSGSGGLTPDLEIALMADGVAPKDVYPMDLDRAFKSLGTLKPDVVKWWEAGAMPAQMLADDEVVMATAWNGRIDSAVKAGAPLEIVWQDQMLRNDCWCVLKGAPNRENAMKLCAFMSMPVQQARLSMLIPYGFINRKAEPLVPADILKTLPSYSENKAKMIVYDDRDWATKRDEVLKRWEAFVLG